MWYVFFLLMTSIVFGDAVTVKITLLFCVRWGTRQDVNFDTILTHASQYLLAYILQPQLEMINVERRGTGLLSVNFCSGAAAVSGWWQKVKLLLLQTAVSGMAIKDKDQALRFGHGDHVEVNSQLTWKGLGAAATEMTSR